MTRAANPTYWEPPESLDLGDLARQREDQHQDPSLTSRRRLEVALALAVVLAVKINSGRRVSQDPQNPTMQLSRLHNEWVDQDVGFGHSPAWYLQNAAKLRGAIVSSTAMLASDALGGYLGVAAQHGVRAALNWLTGPLTRPTTYLPGHPLAGRRAWLGPKQRRELFNSSSLVSRRWADAYAVNLSRGLGEASADGMLVSLAAAARSTLPERLVWAVLYNAVGLPQGQALSATQVATARIAAYRSTRRPLGPRDLAADVAKLYLSRRSRQVLVNESVVAQNFGVQITLMNAVAHGYLPEGSRKVWVTAVDERVCPVCAPMDSVAVPIDQSFLVRSHRGVLHHDTRLWVPPAHINCRCRIVPEAAIEHGIITRTARWSRDNPQQAAWPIPAQYNQDRARLTSRLADIVEQNENPPWLEDASV